jgi:TPR repeat protein
MSDQNSTQSPDNWNATHESTMHDNGILGILVRDSEMTETILQLCLARKFETGIGAACNINEALRIYQLLLLKEEHAIAAARLGYLHESGKAGKPNEEIAFHYWNLSAESGWPWAMNHVARMIELGRGCIKEMSSAKIQYQNAEQRLMELYEERPIVEVCLESMDEFDIDRMEVLARIYEFGLFGEKRDTNKAREWYLKADRYRRTQ